MLHFQSFVGRRLEVLWTEPDEFFGESFGGVITDHYQSGSSSGPVSNIVTILYDDGTEEIGVTLERLKMEWVEGEDEEEEGHQPPDSDGGSELSSDEEEYKPPDSDEGSQLSSDEEGHQPPDSDDELVAVNKKKRRQPALKNRAKAKSTVSKRTKRAPPVPSKKSQKRRQRQGRHQMKEQEGHNPQANPTPPTKPSELQHEVVRAVFSDDAPNVDKKTALLRARLLAGAEGALARLRGLSTAGSQLVTILRSMYEALYSFVADEAEASDLWEDKDVELLRGLSPPQCREDVLLALASIPSCRNILLVISKCAAGDHVAMAPGGAHATLLTACERAGGESTVVLDVAQRVLLCRRASTGGACQDLDKISGLCAVADKVERRVAEIFVSVLLQLLVAHVLPVDGHILLAVNHGGWPDVMQFVDQERRGSHARWRALRSTVIAVGHYRYVLGEVQNLHGRTHLALGYLFAGAMASGRVGEGVLEAVQDAVVDTYGEHWTIKRGKELLTDPSLLVSTAEAVLNELAEEAFLPSSPRAEVDLSSTLLRRAEELYDDVDGEDFSHQLKLLRRWYHELTTADRSNGGKATQDIVRKVLRAPEKATDEEKEKAKKIKLTVEDQRAGGATNKLGKDGRWTNDKKADGGATNKLGKDGRWTNDKKADGGTACIEAGGGFGGERGADPSAAGAAYAPSGHSTRKSLYTPDQLGVTHFQLRVTKSGPHSGRIHQCQYTATHPQAGQPKPMCVFKGQPAPGNGQGDSDYAKADDATCVHEADCVYFGKDYRVKHGKGLGNKRMLPVVPY